MEEEKINVPPIKSQGKKTKIYGLIKTAFDDLEKEEDCLYIEPFVGTGVVGFNLNPKNAIFSDTNPHLIGFYNAIKNKDFNAKDLRLYLESEGKKLLSTPETKESYYYTVRERFNKEKNPLDFLFVSRSCFNGMMRFNRKGGFNVPFCKKPNRFSKSLITKIVNQFIWLEKRIHENDWTFLNEDYKILLEDHKNQDNVIYYLDPPYVNRNNDYYGGWTEKEEDELSARLKQQQGKFILSTWKETPFRKNEYIEKHWKDYHILTKDHVYHVGGQIENRNTVVEAIIIKR